jgi:hypothetical protein
MIDSVDGIEISESLRKLYSNDIAEQVESMEQLAAAMRAIGRHVVRAFADSSNRWVAGERLYKFGQFVVEPLEEIVASIECSEVRILGSLVLGHLGSHAGMPHLLAALPHEDEYLCVIAQHLTRAGVGDAGEMIIARLRALPLSRSDDIVCLVDSLEKLGGGSP